MLPSDSLSPKSSSRKSWSLLASMDRVWVLVSLSIIPFDEELHQSFVNVVEMFDDV